MGKALGSLLIMRFVYEAGETLTETLTRVFLITNSLNVVYLLSKMRLSSSVDLSFCLSISFQLSMGLDFRCGFLVFNYYLIVKFNLGNFSVHRHS